MEKSSPVKDCFDDYDANKYETVAGEFESGDLVLYKSKIYIAKRNGSSSFIYASHSDMKANRKLGSPSKNSLTKIRQKSQSPIKSPTNILSSSPSMSDKTAYKSSEGVQTHQKLERNLLHDFNTKSEPLHEGESVSVLYQPLQKYFTARVQSVQSTAVTVVYSGYSDQAVETIRSEDVPTRVARGQKAESGFTERDLAILIEGQERYHVVIKDMSDWIWVENYDKPDSADWIQVAGLSDVFSKLIKTDPETFYGFKPKERATFDYFGAQYSCTVISVATNGVKIVVDGFADEISLNYHLVKAQLSKQPLLNTGLDDVARMFRSNQQVDSASAIITINGVGLKSFTRIMLRMPTSPLDTSSIVSLSDSLIKMKIWDIVEDGKLEAAGEYEQNGTTVTTDWVTVAVVKLDGATVPKVQLNAADNWLVPHWKDIASQAPLSHLTRGASWNVSAGKYGLYTPKLNWLKEKDNYLRQNNEGSAPADEVHFEQLLEEPVEVEAMFSLSPSVFNVSRLSKSTPPVVITCNQGVFKSPVRVLLKTNDGKTLTECKAQVVAPKKASFRLPVDDLLKMKPSTINVHVALGESPLRDTNLSMEFKEDDSVFKEAEAPRSRFPKQFNGQLLHLDLAETTVQFSVPSQVYDSCMQFTGPFYIKDKYIIGANEEQRNDIKHWIFNPSHNRSSKAKLDYSTSENKSSYTQVVVVRSGAQFEQYQQVWGSSHIIMVLPLYFGTSSDNNGIGYARKVIMAVADKLNLKRIWLIDDNVCSFYKLNTKTVKYDKCDITDVLKGIEDIFACAQTTNEKYSSSACLAELPKGNYFDVYNDGPFSQNAVISQNAMKARLEKMDPVSRSDLFIGAPNNYGVIGIARLGQFQHIYKKPFVRDQVYSCLLINLEAIRQRNKVLEKSNLPLITYPEYPIFEDMKFNDICDFNGLWVIKSNRFLHKKVQTKEIKGTQKVEWRKQFVSSFDLYGKINGHISRLPFKTLHVRKFATINDLKYMIERHPDIGTKKYGKILQLNSIAEHDTSLSLGHSLKDYNIVAKIFHTDDKELDDKIHKLHIEFEKAAFDIIPTKQLYFDIKYGPPETAQVFYPIAAIVVHGSADSNVQVELRVVEKIQVKRMIMPLSGKSRTATFKNITFDKAGHYKFIAVALQDPPMSVEADHMTHVIDLTAQRSSDYFQQGLRLSVKLEECDMEVKKKYHHEHEFYEKTWPAHRARFVNTQGFHLRICQYLAYVCYLSHVHKAKSSMSAVVKLPTGAGKTVLGCLLPFLAAKNKVLILTTSPLISSEFKKALSGSRKRKEISMFERYALLHPSAFPSVAIFKEKESLKDVTKICTQANYIVCNYQKLTQGKVVRENGYLQMLSKLHIDMIIVDEAHHDAADSYQAIYNYFPGAKKILLTATPFRTDQKTLGGTDGARPIFNYSIQDALKAKIIKDISHVTVRAQNMTISGLDFHTNQSKQGIFKCYYCGGLIKKKKEREDMIVTNSGEVWCGSCQTVEKNFEPLKNTKKERSVTTIANESSLIHNYYPQKQFSMAILGQKKADKKACFIDPEAISPSVEILLRESLLKLQEKRSSSVSRLHHKIIVYCDSIDDTITVTKFYNEVALKLFKEKKLHSILRAAAFHSNPDSESKDRIEQHQIDVVVQSKMLGEGYDHKEFTIAVLVGSKIKSLSKYIQFVGRIMRRLVNGDKQDNQAVIFVHDGLQFEKLWQAYKGEDVAVSFETLSKTDTQYKITKEEHYMTFESLAQTSSQSSSAHK